jgi:hypothetical protein
MISEPLDITSFEPSKNLSDDSARIESTYFTAIRGIQKRRLKKRFVPSTT